MTAAVWIGILLALLAGMLSGNCMLPAKFIRRWPWENTWLVFSLISLVVLPWLLAALLVKNLAATYALLPWSDFAAPFVFGLGWGIAQVLFGMSIARLGLALGYAIIVGLGALLGTLVPLLVQHRSVAGTSRGALIFLGMAIMLLGIGVSAWSGWIRDRMSTETAPKHKYGAALLLAVLCGIMAPMLNYAFAFGQSIAVSSVAAGNSRESAGYAIWPVALSGGLIPNLIYSVYLLTANRTWTKFRQPGVRELSLASLMGLLWMGAFAIYGVSSTYLGLLGTSVGWGLFQIFMIMTATLSGVFTGEWKSASSTASRGLWCGLGLLGIATAIIAAGER
jgi:L-rhamnose-H+ transport protein